METIAQSIIEKSNDADDVLYFVRWGKSGEWSML